MENKTELVDFDTYLYQELNIKTGQEIKNEFPEYKKITRRQILDASLIAKHQYDDHYYFTWQYVEYDDNDNPLPYEKWLEVNHIPSASQRKQHLKNKHIPFDLEKLKEIEKVNNLKDDLYYIKKRDGNYYDQNSFEFKRYIDYHFESIRLKYQELVKKHKRRFFRK